MKKDKFVEEMLNYPNLELLMVQAQAALDREKLDREKFRQQLRAEGTEEFVNGKRRVLPIASERHRQIRDRLRQYVQNLIGNAPTGYVAPPGAVIGLTRNDYLPDLAYFHGARSDAKTMLLQEAPNWVVEITEGERTAHNRGIKLRDYAAHHITEYWLVDLESNAVEQYHLPKPEADAYELFQKVRTGDRVTSILLPDLSIKVADLVAP